MAAMRIPHVAWWDEHVNAMDCGTCCLYDTLLAVRMTRVALQVSLLRQVHWQGKQSTKQGKVINATIKLEGTQLGFAEFNGVTTLKLKQHGNERMI